MIPVVDVCAHGVYVCTAIVDIVLDIHGVNETITGPSCKSGS